MSFDTFLKAHLQGATGLDAVSDRITPQPVPEGSPRPCITYRRIADHPLTDLDGGDGQMQNIRVQIDCWAEKRIQAMALIEAVRVRMQTAHSKFTSVPTGTFIDDYEPQTKLFRASRDFSCWYRNT